MNIKLWLMFSPFTILFKNLLIIREHFIISHYLGPSKKNGYLLGFSSVFPQIRDFQRFQGPEQK